MYLLEVLEDGEVLVGELDRLGGLLERPGGVLQRVIAPERKHRSGMLAGLRFLDRRSSSCRRCHRLLQMRKRPSLALVHALEHVLPQRELGIRLGCH